MDITLPLNVATSRFTALPGGASPLRELFFKRGDSANITIPFYNGSEVLVQPELTDVVFVIKNDISGDPLALADTWTRDETTGAVTAELNLDTEELATFLGDSRQARLLAEFTYTDDGNVRSTRITNVTVENDLWKGTETTPLSLPSPEEWIEARAVLYDREQSLDPAAQLQARENLALGTAATVNTGTTEGTIPLLGAGGKFSADRLPAIALTHTRVVDDTAARLALSVADAAGKIVVEADTGESYGLVIDGDPANAGDWVQVGDRDVTISDVDGLQDTLDGFVSLGTLSFAGGALKVPQLDASGNFKTGPHTNGGGAFGAPGNLLIPDQQGIRWLRKDGSTSGAEMRMWQDHDIHGGELIIDSPFRFAMICPGPFQLGNNASGNRAFYLHMVSGAATSDKPLRWSPAVSFQTRTWNGGTPTEAKVAMQAEPLAGGGRRLMIFDDASVTDDTTSPGNMSNNAGKVTGTMIADFRPDGLWTPGTNPVAESITDAPTVQQNCSPRKNHQLASVTLAGSRTLVINGAANGMRGTLFVSQDSVGGRTLTLPVGSSTPIGFALSSDPLVTDQLEWVFSGNRFYFRIVESYPFLYDLDADAFFTRASIDDFAQKQALNDLVLGLKTNALYERMHAIYPLVGGTALAHTKNLISDTRHIEWFNSPTHNTNGVTGNGTNACGVAGFRFSDVADGLNSVFCYVYSRTESLAGEQTFLAAVDGSSNRIGIRGNGTNLIMDGINRNQIGTAVIGASSDYRGHMAAIRESSASQRIYLRGLPAIFSDAASVGAGATNMGILCRNASSGTRDQFSAANIAFVAFGQSLNGSQYATWRSLVDAYQSALGRAV